MIPEIYFTQISNLSEARFATSVMAKGIAFCLEKEHPDYVTPTTLNSFKEWLIGSDWIAHLSQEPNTEIREIMDYFEIKQVLHQSKLYNYNNQQEAVIVPANLIKTLTPLQSKEDFNMAFKNKTPNVLLFGSKEEEVGMANMDQWISYFEALEIL